MPGQKGILGVAKDPKNPILFTYGGEAWPSDDSDDSDYEPPEEKEEGKKGQKDKKRKRKKELNKNEKNAVSAAKKRKKEEPRSEAVASGTDLWGHHLPVEVLVNIFQHAVSDQALPFLCRAARVCRLWQEASSQAVLWCKMDLSYAWIKSTDKTLTWLAENRLTRCREINLSVWKALTNTGLQTLCDNCPLLETVSLSHCSKINSEGIRHLVDKCENLSSIDLSFANSDAVSPQCLKYLIEKRGATLKHLNFSGNNLKGFNGIINAISQHCPHLEGLDICNAIFSSDFLSLNIERIQGGCPNLRFLRLTNSKFRATAASARQQAESRGFPELEELSLAISSEGLIDMGLGMDDEFLHRLLKSSRKLRLLDMRGSTHLSTAGLQQLPCTDLQHLFISQSSTAKYDGIEVIMQKWQHSLQELDLSWNVYPGMSLDLAMRKLSDDPSKSRLESLNLSGTCISCARLKSLLEGCPNLKVLNLCSCRGLPRGMKREYSGDSLVALRRDIDSIIREHEGHTVSIINAPD